MRASSQGQDDVAAVNALLERRAEAVRTGDRAAFLATIDPRATPGFREQEARSFDGLRTVPLAGYTLRARTDDTGDLGTGLGERYGGAPVFLPETRATYRIEGYDDRDQVDTHWYTYVQRGERWYVAGDTDLEDLGLLSARNLWDFGPVAALRSDHLLVLSRPEQAERAQALLALGDEAVQALLQRWDQPWSGRIPVLLPASPEELGRIIQATFDVEKYVAFVTYGPVRDDGYVTTAPRMYIQDRNLARHTRSFQLETLVHELNHAAVAPYAGPAVPAWVHEGVADWLATGRPTGTRRPGGSDGILPRDYEILTGSAAAILRSYRESTSAISSLAARFGPEAPPRLLRALGEAGPVAGSVDHHVDATLRTLFGLSLAEFERGWRTR